MEELKIVPALKSTPAMADLRSAVLYHDTRKMMADELRRQLDLVNYELRHARRCLKDAAEKLTILDIAACVDGVELVTVLPHAVYLLFGTDAADALLVHNGGVLVSDSERRSREALSRYIVFKEVPQIAFLFVEYAFIYRQAEFRAGEFPSYMAEERKAAHRSRIETFASTVRSVCAARGIKRVFVVQDSWPRRDAAFAGIRFVNAQGFGNAHLRDPAGMEQLRKAYAFLDWERSHISNEQVRRIIAAQPQPRAT